MRIAFILSLLVVTLATAQNLDVQRALEDRVLPLIVRALNEGEHDLVALKCEQAIEQGLTAPDWHRHRVTALLAMGHKDEALAACEAMLAAHPDDLTCLMQQHQAAVVFGLKPLAEATLKRFDTAAKLKPAKDRNALELVALGQAALALGADPKQVIDNFYSPAKRKDAKADAPYLAAGALALSKADAALASEEYQAGLKAHGETTELRFGLAQAFAESDSAESLKQIALVLETNPRHVGALLLRARHQLRAEEFLPAAAALNQAIEVNASSPEAWALRAVLATLEENDAFLAANHRSEALKLWSQNPAVDHLIGLCLSRAYRFAEGAQHQREALAFDADYLPARLQLCHDLLRLGQEDEAWQLAAKIREADGYNTQAHNIGLLEEEMASYLAREEGGFRLRMTQRDWDVYGRRALELLAEAKAVLGKKYGHEFDPTKPVLVEFFPSQQDFAIRTFGSLGGQGLLGVCFGTVITMNSPGALASGRSNWESTLWHEFCHVVTLSATHNRMPRWLSEGLSVYEEQQKNAAWGMKMTAEYRRMILEDEDAVTPLSQMSSAFMRAKSGEAVMFAYYESSVAVAWLIESYGWEKFRAILASLAAGDRVNEAIAKHTAPMDDLEPAFEKHLMALARRFGSKADWTKPKPDDLDATDAKTLAAYVKKNPSNLWAAQQQAQALMKAKDWPALQQAAQHLVDLCPDDLSLAGGRWLKIMALRQQNKSAEESQELRLLADLSGDAEPAFQRLLKLDAEAKNWPAVLTNARRWTALNPFLAEPNEAIAQAAEATGDKAAAIQANERLLLLKPANPALIRFKLAKLLQATDDVKAKRHLLDALALAPRYREAQQMLIEMAERQQ